MAHLGYDLTAVNPERLTEYMRSRIKAHRKEGGPCYGQYRGTGRLRQSPFKDMTQEKKLYLKKIGRKVTLSDPPFSLPKEKAEKTEKVRESTASLKKTTDLSEVKGDAPASGKRRRRRLTKLRD